MKKQLILIDLIAAILLLLFLYTALAKLFNHQQFEAVLSKSPLLGTHARILSWAIPIAELIIAAALCIVSIRYQSLIAALIMLLIFTLYLFYMVVFTPTRPCNCGGVLSQLTWPQHILFNIFFIILTIIGIVLCNLQRRFVVGVPP